jgi:hypothetical protein
MWQVLGQKRRAHTRSVLVDSPEGQMSLVRHRARADDTVLK